MTGQGDEEYRQGMVVYVEAELEDLVPEFLANRRRDVEQIRRLAREGGYGELKELGHTLKGVGGGYGFTEISVIGQAIEEASMRSDRQAITTLCERLAAYLVAIQVKVRTSG